MENKKVIPGNSGMTFDTLIDHLPTNQKKDRLIFTFETASFCGPDGTRTRDLRRDRAAF